MITPENIITERIYRTSIVPVATVKTLGGMTLDLHRPHRSPLFHGARETGGAQGETRRKGDHTSDFEDLTHTQNVYNISIVFISIT